MVIFHSYVSLPEGTINDYKPAMVSHGTSMDLRDSEVVLCAPKTSAARKLLEELFGGPVRT